MTSFEPNAVIRGFQLTVVGSMYPKLPFLNAQGPFLLKITTVISFFSRKLRPLSLTSVGLRMGAYVGPNKYSECCLL